VNTADATDVDTTFDRYARLVRRGLRTPVALVTLVEAERQVFPGAVGLPEPWQTERETPLSHSFCQHVVADRAPLVVTDARQDDRLRENLAIRDLDVIAYAGWPLTDHTGDVVGSLCAIAHEPREWTEEDLEVLADLAAACSTELAERGLRAAGARSLRLAESMTHRSRVLLALSEALSATRTPSDVATALERVSVEQLGCLRAGIWLSDETGEALRYVPPAGTPWDSAQLHGALSVDDRNPLGDALLARRLLSYPTAEGQNERYPTLDVSRQIGEGRVFLPLTDEGQVHGAMALVWEGPRHLSVAERTTLGALASYATQALQRALLLQERQDALVTLQNAMLPRLPRVADLELAARYRPAAERDQVGGDWYDAVVMPSGDISLMVGDVVGHDLVAAATMGQLRTMLRAIAWSIDAAPSLNVRRLDQAMRDLDVDGLATLGYARLEQDECDRATGRRTFRWTSAGHPPPLLIAADGTTRLLDEGDNDLMLGVLPDSERSDNRVQVEAGSTVLLYTDGLVERRGEHLDDGLARLCFSAADHHALPVADFLDAVLDDLLGARLVDDVAVLAVRFTPPA
jgi:serine phosphatase RsbU (regulator of sigma subunit)